MSLERELKKAYFTRKPKKNVIEVWAPGPPTRAPFSRSKKRRKENEDQHQGK